METRKATELVININAPLIPTGGSKLACGVLGRNWLDEGYVDEEGNYHEMESINFLEKRLNENN